MGKQIKQIAVIGAGQMGRGIAQVFATKGYKVSLIDLEEKTLTEASKLILQSLKKLEEKSQLGSLSSQEVLENIVFSQKLEASKEAQLIIEAIVEREDIKKLLFKNLSTICPDPDTIFASNTSSISITRLAKSVLKPENFIGIHFMNPVPLMKLVEVVTGMHTSDETLKVAQALITDLGKESVVSKDFPGFIVNRILMPMINEAFCVLSEGIASPKDIDQAMKLGTNQPMGPLQLADFIGLDTCLSIMRVLYEGFLDPKYRPNPLLSQYVDSGLLGRKTKRGVYTYE